MAQNFIGASPSAHTCVCVCARVWIHAKDVPLCRREAAKLVNGDGSLFTEKVTNQKHVKI